MARVLSDEEIRVFRDLFDSYDADKSGHISVEEFAQAMARSPGAPRSREEVEQIVREVDPNGDGHIGFNEFVTMMTGQPFPPPTQAELDEREYAKAWRVYEPSLHGSITASQFRQLMADLGEPVSDSEVERLINNIDGEGKVSYKVFVRFMNNRGAEFDIVSSYQ
ncbi:EF-hand [Xylaria intraflava]|nr:EF-hand [Xylaria intraflava]